MNKNCINCMHCDPVYGWCNKNNTPTCIAGCNDFYETYLEQQNKRLKFMGWH